MKKRDGVFCAEANLFSRSSDFERRGAVLYSIVTKVAFARVRVDCATDETDSDLDDASRVSLFVASLFLFRSRRHQQKKKTGHTFLRNIRTAL